MWSGLRPRNLHFNPFSPFHSSDVNKSTDGSLISNDPVVHVLHVVWEGPPPSVMGAGLELAPQYTQRGTPLEMHTVEEADCAFICLGT